MEYTRVSPSASVAEIVPTSVSFSLIVKVGMETNSGKLSFRLLTAIVISWVLEFKPSVAVTVDVKFVFVS